MSQAFVAAQRAKHMSLQHRGTQQADAAALQAEAQQAAAGFAAAFQRAELLPRLRAWDQAAVVAAGDTQSRQRLLRADADDVGPVVRRLLERGDARGLAAHLSATLPERCQELYDALQRGNKQESFAGYEPSQFRLAGGPRVLLPEDVVSLCRYSPDSYIEVPHRVLDADSAHALYNYFRVHYWEAGVMEQSENPCNAGSYNASLPFRSFGRGVGQVITPGSPPAALLRAVELMTAVAAEITACGYPHRLLVPQAIKLGCYAPGPARYRPHLDNYGEGGAGGRRQAGNAREVTVLLYPNPPDWDAEADGGCLRLLRDTEDSSQESDGLPVGSHGLELRTLPPAGGRCVVFLSRKVLHEVLPTRRLRFCLTLWLERAPTTEQGDPIKP